MERVVQGFFKVPPSVPPDILRNPRSKLLVLSREPEMIDIDAPLLPCFLLPPAASCLRVGGELKGQEGVRLPVFSVTPRVSSRPKRIRDTRQRSHSPFGSNPAFHTRDDFPTGALVKPRKCT